MAAFADSPCVPWEPIWCGTPTEVDPAAILAASEILWALSGRRFGLCEVTVRPCRRDCMDVPWREGWMPWDGAAFTPALIGGLWFNLTCGGCSGGCSCAAVSEALLPAPVAAVTLVKVDGAAVPTGSYRVDDGRLLVRTDGGTWPLCNNLGVADTEPGTWSVTVQVGEPVPAAGQLAVAELAAEIQRACSGEDCRLPRQVRELVRQGVTISMPDPAELSDKGLLGLTLSDRFLQAFNPNRLQARSRAYRVDGAPWRRIGG